MTPGWRGHPVWLQGEEDTCVFPQLHTITISKRKLDIFGNDLDSNTIWMPYALECSQQSKLQ